MPENLCEPGEALKRPHWQFLSWGSVVLRLECSVPDTRFNCACSGTFLCRFWNQEFRIKGLSGFQQICGLQTQHQVEATTPVAITRKTTAPTAMLLAKSALQEILDETRRKKSVTWTNRPPISSSSSTRFKSSEFDNLQRRTSHPRPQPLHPKPLNP